MSNQNILSDHIPLSSLYLSPSSLLPYLLSPSPLIQSSLLVVDCREDDFLANIPNAINIPAHSFSENMEKIWKEEIKRNIVAWEDDVSNSSSSSENNNDNSSSASSSLSSSSSSSSSSPPLPTSRMIVFHCMQSQMRGPSCAMKFIRAIKEGVFNKQLEERKKMAEKIHNDNNNNADASKSKRLINFLSTPVEVRILEGGFMGWVKYVYRLEDSLENKKKLIENYQVEDYGYPIFK